MIKKIIFLIVATTCVSTVSVFAAGSSENTELETITEAGDPTKIDVQERFDYLGPVVEKLVLSNGKTVAYVDEGKEDWIPVLFIGGSGTAERIMVLTEFLRTLRTQLGLRIITVGRNGFGETDYVSDWGYEDYAREVEEVLDHLGVEKFVGLAISGGGPYLAAVSAAMPDRITSIHMAVALSVSAPDAWNATATVEQLETKLRYYSGNPLKWWNLGEASPMKIVPGFQDTANEDGTRSFFMGGQLGLEDEGIRTVQWALAEEYNRFTSEITDLSTVTAPTYTYYSPADTAVGMEHAEYWANHLNVVKARVYPESGHATQYRHWGQIMLDMAGYSNYLLISNNEQSMIVPEEEGLRLIEEGSATLGILAWKTGARK